MPKLKISRRLALTIVCAAGLAALGVTLTAASSPSPSPSSSPPPMLSTVSATVLAQAGIQLQEPTSTAAISQSAAEQAALQQMPGSTVREAVLTDFSDAHAVPSISTLAWAISLTPPPGFRAPSQGPAPGPATGNPALNPASYMVIFIDAKTGAFIEGTAGS